MVSMANKDIEMACDFEMIRDAGTAFRKQYSETILSAIHKGNIRQTVLSTYFYGGKDTMKERFANIFDMSKKRKGIIAFLVVLVSAILIGGMVACSMQSADTKIVNTGSYIISVSDAWDVDIFSGATVRFMKDGNEIGFLETLGYDPSLPISQLEGNHAETLSMKQLDGCKYPAIKVMIRRTQPAAAMDDSYVDELHIYLIPENSKIAYDLSFDLAKVDGKTVEEIAKTFILSSDDNTGQEKNLFDYENVRDAFYERVNYNPDEDLLSFTIPEAIPKDYKFYLHVSGRAFVGDSSDGVSFHRFDEESESFGWIKGKTYTCTVKSENLDEGILDFGLIDKNGQEILSTIHIYPDGTKRIDSTDDFYGKSNE